MENNIQNNAVNKKSYSFIKKERLCSKKVIDKLFTEGESFLVFPLKFVFLKTALSSDFPVQAGFSVGKKVFKKAVQRNLLKRRMREAYRLNKHDLYINIEDKQLALFIIYIGKSIIEYKPINDAMKKGIKKLVKEINENQLKQP
ncbi:MAG: ribonuclease P protein component [Prolixibacteraceae bacterium]|nr:ribonuclease P protein component [Prolixibacteraceae bacterium]